jgi:hypothetical protein
MKLIDRFFSPQYDAMAAYRHGDALSIGFFTARACQDFVTQEILPTAANVER